MIENSSTNLVMLDAEVTVTVTREEHHQFVLARYPVVAGAQRHVAVELGWCTIATGKYRGQPAIEVRLDGHRVGELTYAMSQRYGPVVTTVAAHGGRPGCEATIQHGVKELEVSLRLPRASDGTVPLSTPSRIPNRAPTPRPRAAVPRRRGIFVSHKPVWIAAAIVAIAFLGAIANNTDSGSPSTAPSTELAGTATRTTAAPPTTTTPTTAPPVTTTTTVAMTTTVTPAPKPANPQLPNPRTTTTRTATPAPPPPPVEPKPDCDPNYGGCVPIASDVDCMGGGGNGPAYVRGPIRVIGRDIYDLDRDDDGVACE